VEAILDERMPLRLIVVVSLREGSGSAHLVIFSLSAVWETGMYPSARSRNRG